MTLKELIARIRVVALSGQQEPSPTLLNSQVLIEVLLPRCLDVLAEKVARTPDGLHALRKEIVLAIVAGSIALPDTIKEEHLLTASISNDPTATYVPTWLEFSSGSPIDVSRFTVRNGLFYYWPSGAINSYSGNVSLEVVARPQLPATITDQVDLRDVLLQQLIVFTASVINGQVPLGQIGLDYAGLEEVRKRAEVSD